LIGGFGYQLFFDNSADNETHSVRQGGYLFINPLLECEVGDQVSDKSLASFRQKVVELIDEQLTKESLQEAAVYYRDLNNGPWYGINEDNTFDPASLLKVPVMMAYYKLAESDPTILSNKVTGQGIEVEVSISDLIEKMIVESDNNSFQILMDNIDFAEIEELHRNLNIPVPNAQTDDYLTVKDYASLFRILYNASYLNREMSETALDLLSRTAFNDGLVAGIKEKLAVAHKYGIRATEQSPVRQLHDCGIVYYPDHPYLLCIMTKGTNLSEQKDYIAAISQLVYQEWNEKYDN
jgi:beta-lactamase class A